MTRHACVAEANVGPVLVVLAAVVFDDDAGLGEDPELLAVEAIVAEAIVEGFDETVLPGADGLDIALQQVAFTPRE